MQGWGRAVLSRRSRRSCRWSTGMIAGCHRWAGRSRTLGPCRPSTRLMSPTTRFHTPPLSRRRERPSATHPACASASLPPRRGDTTCSPTQECLRYHSLAASSGQRLLNSILLPILPLTILVKLSQVGFINGNPTKSRLYPHFFSTPLI